MKTAKTDLSFPDKDLRVPGRVHLETAQAMRDAKGDRRVAAQQLGISLGLLTKRLHVIRGLQKA